MKGVETQVYDRKRDNQIDEKVGKFADIFACCQCILPQEGGKLSGKAANVHYCRVNYYQADQVGGERGCRNVISQKSGAECDAKQFKFVVRVVRKDIVPAGQKAVERQNSQSGYDGIAERDEQAGKCLISRIGAEISV